eukprot:TRINITY_DN60174_c0_g1_i1.p1 TRINITY_DN60174_c0_g1~~TRINITY_DN60174_c0_g1_i1.p1  ORF type:complete len:852 (+),score=185.76 TRINITY_DN60174_c0_g1_i1:82-2556(+)
MPEQLTPRRSAGAAGAAVLTPAAAGSWQSPAPGGQSSSGSDGKASAHSLGHDYVDRRLRELWGPGGPPAGQAGAAQAAPSGHAATGALPGHAATGALPAPVHVHSSEVSVFGAPGTVQPPPRPAPPLRHHDRTVGRLAGPAYPRVPSGGRVTEQPLGDAAGRLLLIIATVAGRSLVLAHNGLADLLLLVEIRAESAGGRPIRRRGSAQQREQRSRGQRETVLTVAVAPGHTEELADGWFNTPLRPRWQVVPLPQALADEQIRDKQGTSRMEHERLAGGIVNELSAPHPEGAVLRTAAERRIPFVDLWFPPQPSSLVGEQAARAGRHARSIDCWSRPAGCVAPAVGVGNRSAPATPALFATAPAPNDLERGPVGDAALLCCLAALAEGPSPGQPFDLLRPCFAAHTQQHSDIGACVVQLVRGGWWRDILIDDYLPLAQLTSGSAVLAPAGIRSVLNPAEVWPSLLEKAYAKVAGGYLDIGGAQPHDILSDITGYPAAPLRWGQGPALLADVTEWRSRGFPLLLSVPGLPRGTDEARGPGDEQYEAQGLLAGHSYSVLRVVQSNSGVALLQIRNPWADAWQGQWHRNSTSWTPELRAQCGVSQSAETSDGTFWVSWEEACRWFLGGAVLYVLPDAGELRAALRLAPRPRWVLELHFGVAVRIYVGVHPRAAREDVHTVPPRLIITLLDEDGAPGEYRRYSDAQAEGARSMLAVHELEPSPRPRLLAVHVAEEPEGFAQSEDSLDVVVSLHYVALDPVDVGAPKGTAVFRDAAPVAAALEAAGPAAAALWLPAAYQLAPAEAVAQQRTRCAELPHPTAPSRVSRVAF